MVGDVSWEQRERGEEKERTDATGESLAAASAGAIGMGGQPEQEELSGGAVPPAGGEARKEACFDGCRKFDTRDFVSPAHRIGSCVILPKRAGSGRLDQYRKPTVIVNNCVLIFFVGA